MKLSFRALQDYVDLSVGPLEVASTLASLGFPNDGIKHIGSGLDQVVVGKILSRDKHPQADRLSLLKVNAGAGPLAIVCGAQNMKVGDYVALAPVGAKIPGKDGSGMVMKEAKIRGETSLGMCCSLEELQLSESSEGIWILPASKVSDEMLGKKVKEIFDWEDWIFEIDVTPNRGDCLSVRGLARELAAKLKLKMKVPNLVRWKSPSSTVNPTIENFEDTYGFAACLVQGVTFGASSDAMKRFLEAAGARSLSNLVDITNQVLFELGHPIHFFDADKVDLKTITSRRARVGEKLKLLNGAEIELHPEDIVIADQSGPLSLAGVMGGLASSVTESTKNILIEAASFNSSRIRATSKRHLLNSESSYRFERGVLPHRLDEVIERALALLKENSGFESASGSKVVVKDLAIPSVLWDRPRIEAKLGKLAPSDDELFQWLRRLEYEFEPKGSTTRVIFPWYRTDCQFLEDLMEDIARLVGYDALEQKPLVSLESVQPLKDFSATLKVSNELVSGFVHHGFSETIHMSFSNPLSEAALGLDTSSAYEILNPIHSEKSHLRQSLLPQLLSTAQKNAYHGEEEIRLVEAGPIFRSKIEGFFEAAPASEVWALGVVWMPRPLDRKRLWKAEIDPLFEFKGIVEAVMERAKLKVIPSQSASMSELLHPKRRFKVAGVEVGELHPSYVQKMDLPSKMVFVGEWIIEGGLKPWSLQKMVEFPPVDMDLCLVVPKSVSGEALSKILLKSAPSSLEDLRLYDVFEAESLGKNKKSMTFALRYRSSERTLTTEEVKKAHEDLIAAVIKAFPSGDVALR